MIHILASLYTEVFQHKNCYPLWSETDSKWMKACRKLESGLFKELSCKWSNIDDPCSEVVYLDVSYESRKIARSK